MRAVILPLPQSQTLHLDSATIFTQIQATGMLSFHSQSASKLHLSVQGKLPGDCFYLRALGGRRFWALPSHPLLFIAGGNLKSANREKCLYPEDAHSLPSSAGKPNRRPQTTPKLS